MLLLLLLCFKNQTIPFIVFIFCDEFQNIVSIWVNQFLEKSINLFLPTHVAMVMEILDTKLHVTFSSHQFATKRIQSRNPFVGYWNSVLCTTSSHCRLVIRVSHLFGFVSCVIGHVLCDHFLRTYSISANACLQL